MHFYSCAGSKIEYYSFGGARPVGAARNSIIPQVPQICQVEILHKNHPLNFPKFVHFANRQIKKFLV